MLLAVAAVLGVGVVVVAVALILVGVLTERRAADRSDRGENAKRR